MSADTSEVHPVLLRSAGRIHPITTILQEEALAAILLESLAIRETRSALHGTID